MYKTIQNAISPYLNECDALWEETGVESVTSIFETFSLRNWEQFIQEIPDDISDIDVRIIDCLTQMNSDNAIKAAAKIAMSCTQGAFTLFLLRLDSNHLTKIPRSDLVAIEKRALFQKGLFQGEFAVIYKESVKMIQNFLHAEN